MRLGIYTLAACLLAASTSVAQQNQPAAPALDPANNKLDALLLRWEKEMKNIQTLQVQATRTTVNKTFGNTVIFQGGAKYMKPDLALMEMQQKDKPGIFEKYVITGTFLYDFAPAQKLVRIYELPPTRPGAPPGEDNILSFLFGMKAEEAKRRYDLKLVKEDQWYIYVEVLPKLPSDKADFQKARLVLNQSNFLPRELWFEQPNGDEVKWDLPKADVNPKLSRTDFLQPQLPPGWTSQRMPKVQSSNTNSLPPRVIRPKQ